MTVQDLVGVSLDNFGIDSSTWNKYNLIEVSLEKGIAERTVNSQEEMLQLIRNLRKVASIKIHMYHLITICKQDSLRRYNTIRLYLQEKEDPHSKRFSHCCFKFQNECFTY